MASAAADRLDLSNRERALIVVMQACGKAARLEFPGDEAGEKDVLSYFWGCLNLLATDEELGRALDALPAIAEAMERAG